jgi:hypothetical protein
VVFGLAERAGGAFARRGDTVIVSRVGFEVGELVGDLNLPIRRSGIHEDDLNIEIQEMGDRGEDLRGNLAQRCEQEIHRRVGGVLAESGAALDGDPLGDPAGGGQLRPWLQCPLRDQGEDYPLGSLPVQAPTPGDPTQRSTDTETFPEPVQHPRPTQSPGVDHLDFGAMRCTHRLLRLEEPRDRSHQPRQRILIDLVGAPEAVDHLRRRYPGVRVTLAVR